MTKNNVISLAFIGDTCVMVLPLFIQKKGTPHNTSRENSPSFTGRR
jgi:hypothetical protein